jgi:hypothetical protein
MIDKNIPQLSDKKEKKIRDTIFCVVITAATLLVCTKRKSQLLIRNKYFRMGLTHIRGQYTDLPPKRGIVPIRIYLILKLNQIFHIFLCPKTISNIVK